MPAVANSDLVARITDLGEQATAGSDIELVEVQVRGAGKSRLLRVYIDKAGGVTHGDCEFVSERIGKLLDDAEAVPDDSYTLEVSSLGADRKFNNLRDYQRVIGQKLALTLRTPFQGMPRLEGKLTGADPESLELETADRRMVVPLDHVAKAKLKFEP